MLLLLIFTFIAGMKAGGLPVTYYRQTSSSFCLQVRKPSDLIYVDWSCGEKAITVRQEITPIYKDRVDYHSNNHSLCIHQLTEADTGTYEVLLVKTDYSKSTEKTKLVVQAPVPKPVIRMSLGSRGSNLSSAGICELAVNCSVGGDWLLALCSQDSCRTSERFYSKVNITISAHNKSVVCSGHNHVSVHNASENMEETCYTKSNKKYDATSPPFNEMVIVITVVVGSLIFAFIACLAVRLCVAKYNRRQTSAAQLVQNQPVQPRPQPATRDSTSSSQHEASYENVDVMQPPTSSPSVNAQEELESKQSQTVDTVYSVLQLPRVNGSLSDRGSSTKEHEVIEVAASESGEAEHHMQVDSVYSMVQKPKT